jgi:hypothetical protein
VPWHPFSAQIASLVVPLPGRSLLPVLGLFAGFFRYIGASDLRPGAFTRIPNF